MNYKIGDIVIKKPYTEKYIFLGTSDNESVKPIKITKEIMGEKVEIGMFIHKPVEIVYNADDDNYVVELLFYNTELFEKDEEKIKESNKEEIPRYLIYDKIK